MEEFLGSQKMCLQMETLTRKASLRLEEGRAEGVGPELKNVDPAALSST